MKMSKPYYCIFLLLMICGCQSSKCMSNAHKVSSAVCLQPLKFSIVDADGFLSQQEQTMLFSLVQMRNRQNHSLFNSRKVEEFDPDEVLKEIKSRYVALLRKTAKERYPQLFDDEGVPLKLQMKMDVKDSRTRSLILSFGTLLIFGGLLPLPISAEVNYTVNPVIADSRYREFKLDQADGKLRTSSWMTVYTPLGLIPYPGEAGCKWSVNAFSGMLSGQSQGMRNCTEQEFADILIYGINRNQENKVTFFAQSIIDTLVNQLVDEKEASVNQLKNSYMKSLRSY